MARPLRGKLGMAGLTQTDRTKLMALLTRNAREGNDDQMSNTIIVDFNRFLADTGRIHEDTITRDGLDYSQRDDKEFLDTMVATPTR